MFLWTPSSLRSGCDADISKTRTGSPLREGTPQGGIISPTLANWTLDGLELLLKKAFPSRKEKGQQIYSKVHLVRYADDFIITGP
jgi:RNA-directed DNA polymerase